MRTPPLHPSWIPSRAWLPTLGLAVLLISSCSDDDCPTCPPGQTLDPSGWRVVETSFSANLDHIRMTNPPS